MVSAIGSVTSGILQQYQQLQFSSEHMTTSQGQSFENLIGMGVVSSPENAADEISMMQGGGASSSSKSEMDLNQDGVVTIDEIMQYMAMQMSQNALETFTADESSDKMSEDNEQNQQQSKQDLEDFKTQMASRAYQMGESLLTTSIGAVTQSFAV